MELVIIRASGFLQKQFQHIAGLPGGADCPNRPGFSDYPMGEFRVIISCDSYFFNILPHHIFPNFRGRTGRQQTVLPVDNIPDLVAERLHWL